MSKLAKKVVSKWGLLRETSKNTQIVSVSRKFCIVWITNKYKRPANIAIRRIPPLRQAQSIVTNPTLKLSDLGLSHSLSCLQGVEDDMFEWIINKSASDSIKCLSFLRFQRESFGNFSYIIHFQMSFASNNSRNVANLLRYEALEPINAPPTLPKRNLPTLNAPPTNQPPSRERQ